MRRALALPAALLCAAAVAVGCGEDEPDPAALQNAASATRDAKTAAIDVRTSVKGFGLPVPMQVNGKGTTALDSSKMQLDLDLGPVLALAGAQGSGVTKIVALGKDMYVDPPQIEGLQLPGGADWVGLDLADLAKAAGIDPRGLGDVLTLDPGKQLEVLRSADGVEEVGKEEVDGVETTHYRGKVRLRDFAETLPPERRKRALEAIEELSAETDTPDTATPFDAWIDDSGRIRKMTQKAAVPAQQGVPAGEMTITYELDDFGTPVKAQRPPKGEVFDATDAVTKAVAAQSGTTTN